MKIFCIGLFLGGEKMKIARCKHCGNLVDFVVDKGVPILCCGEKMEILTANVTDAALEKHLPMATLSEDKLHVEVGSVLHPMTKEHLIQTIIVVNGDKVQRVNFDETMQPIADFTIDTSQGVEIYEYCNLHGLWKAVIK